MFSCGVVLWVSQGPRCLIVLLRSLSGTGFERRVSFVPVSELGKWCPSGQAGLEWLPKCSPPACLPFVPRSQQELVTLEVPMRGRLRQVEVPRECPQEVVDAIAACMQVLRYCP